MLLSANQLLDIRITAVEMPEAIENRRTSDKGRQWAVKRARSSCSGGRRKSSVTKSSKGSEVTNDTVPSRIREMPDSDSEKVGISILGRHFGDSFEIVPIKKRRFLSVQSPSSPLLSSYSDDSDNLLESMPASCIGSLSFDKDHDRSFIANKSSSSNLIIEEATDAADFSGISILAAAACNSEMVGENTSSGNLALVGNSHKEVHLEYTEDNKSHMPCEDKEQQCQSLLQESNVNMRSRPTPAAGDAKFDELRNMKVSMGSLQTVSINLVSPSFSRLHWDLNTDMDAWNSNSDGLVASDVVATDNFGENAEVNEELAVFETCQPVTENGESTNPPELGESLVNMVGTPVNSCMIISNESLDNPNAINGLYVSIHDKDNFCPNVHRSIEEHLSDDTDLHLMNSTVETKHVHYQHNSILCAEVVSSAVGNILGSSKDDSLDIKSVDIDKDEVNASLEANIEAKAFSVNINCEVNSESGTSKARPICVGSECTIAPNEEKSSDDHRLINVQSGNCSFSRAEIVGNVMLDDNICGNLVRACQTFGKSTSFDSIDMTSDLHNEFSGAVGMTQPDQLTCEVTSAAKCESVTKDLKDDVDNTSDLKPTVYFSSGIATAKTDANLVEGAVGTQEDGAVQDPGMEKVNLLVDDDSQFEDGEFRESVLHNWEEDAAEVESEHVDYGSDNDLKDTCETDSIVPASVSFSDVNRAFKERTLSDADKADGEKDRHVAFPQPSSKCSSKSDGSDVVRRTRTIGEVDTLHHANHSALNRGNKQSNVGLQNEGDKTREPSANVRLKSSGWNLLPENHRLAGNNLDREFDSGKQDGPAGSLSVYGDDEPLGRSVLAFRGGLSSRAERLKFSDESRRKDTIFDKLSRYDDRDSAETKAERNTCSLNSTGWCGSLRHTQGRGRAEHWFDSTYCRGSRHHNSPGYYDAQSYARPSSSTAAAAAVAKVESNGFVVAPDGTLVKAGGTGSAGRLSEKSSNASLHSSHPIVTRWGLHDDRDRAYGGHRRPRNPREMSDRHYGVGVQTGECAYDMDNTEYDDRSMPHDRMESSLADRRLSTRDRSSSPYHRGSRSSIRRMERRRSPNPRPSFEQRMNVYGSVSRTIASPSHSSRWVDDRKDSPNHLREHGYGRSSGRSSPLKVYADYRLDSVDSEGRRKPNDYYHHNQRHLPSKRKSEVAGFGRGYKYDGRNDRGRGHGGRYECIRSMRQCDIDSNDKRVR